jgi:HK97 family phage major capsid protein
MASLIDNLRTQRARAVRQAEAVLAAAVAENREHLTADESARFESHKADVERINEALSAATDDLERRNAALGSRVLARLRAKTQDRRAKTQDRRDTVSVHVNEPRTYQRGDPRRSYFSDLARLTLNRDDTGESRQRLANHAQDVADGMEYRDISRVDGAGGYFVPRAWLIDQYVELARPGRAFGNLVTRQPLPGGTDSINVPKILTGTAVGIQVADNTAVVDVDLTDTFVNAQVCTLAGQEGVAIQLIDQSPIAFDQVVFGDLTAAHATQTDLQCFYGTGSNGQVLGLANTAGIGTIAVSGVTVAGVYSGIANAIQQIHTTRFMPPTVILMHPRRWSWLLAQLDQNQRPLFVPNANGPFNAVGILQDVDSQQVVGQLQGLPVVTDPNITTTAGTGAAAGSDDVIYVLRASDIVLYESGVRARVMPEVKASTLTVLCQLYSYLAFTAARFPQSTVELTGLSAPTF